MKYSRYINTKTGVELRGMCGEALIMNDLSQRKKQGMCCCVFCMCAYMCTSCLYFDQTLQYSK